MVELKSWVSWRFGSGWVVFMNFQHQKWQFPHLVIKKVLSFEEFLRCEIFMSHLVKHCRTFESSHDERCAYTYDVLKFILQCERTWQIRVELRRVECDSNVQLSLYYLCSCMMWILKFSFPPSSSSSSVRNEKERKMIAINRENCQLCTWIATLHLWIFQ